MSLTHGVRSPWLAPAKSLACLRKPSLYPPAGDEATCPALRPLQGPAVAGPEAQPGAGVLQILWPLPALPGFTHLLSIGDQCATVSPPSLARADPHLRIKGRPGATAGTRSGGACVTGPGGKGEGVLVLRPHPASTEVEVLRERWA